MNRFTSLSDDFYVNMYLRTEMDLPSHRDSVLSFFEQIQKKYPTMKNFSNRDKGDFILEEDKDQGMYRWCSIDSRRLSSGYVNPPEVEDALEQHKLVLDIIPYMLSFSPMDCEAIDLLYGFDFTYRGNHNQLVAEALGVSPAIERLAEVPGTSVINYEPSFTLALDDDCQLQCRLSIETRTGWYQIRTGDYAEDQLSVYLTTRHVGSLRPQSSLVEIFDKLARTSSEMVEEYVIDNILRPLAQTIALK